MRRIVAVVGIMFTSTVAVDVDDADTGEGLREQLKAQLTEPVGGAWDMGKFAMGDVNISMAEVARQTKEVWGEAIPA